MTERLTPYGSAENAGNIAKVGKSKTPRSLAGRMPSPELVAKVGMGGDPGTGGGGTIGLRVVRRNARG
ncbi:hypothetical protein [Novosphingobium album (ex Liu et al. 2023)]|uniref:Lasso RiPP family leader peptide-containing protein n=1 Tax=Novosphingobium album (ex Liu et al. 2023) TaxID=3031130 RepID=A0ABT5WJS3_9SPHN|nr:hypothetical protein [Novosphingobium album (ex Liu et al. 2023)]MDE8650299.1 hypothetical protein [Novosphingobium album (ex Liu et al. 2023)]